MRPLDSATARFGRKRPRPVPGEASALLEVRSGEVTPDAFRAHLTRLGYSQAGFARFIGYSDRSVRRFASGVEPVPLVVQRLLEALA